MRWGLRNVVTFSEAERRLRGLSPCGGAALVALPLAHGRVAAETVRAPEDLPRLLRSAMDGYALRVADTSSGALQCVDALYAGDAPGRALPPGQCVAVATGAALPPGADAVAPREHTRADGTTIRLLRTPTPGENVVAPGEEGRSGAVLVPAGTRIGPRHIAAMAAYGMASVAVREPLRVGLLATGDELVQPGLPARPEQVYESGTLALGAELHALGLRVDRCAPCPDVEADLSARFTTLLQAGTYQAIVTTGGVSGGDRDLVPGVWERLGAERIFWRVGVKPGRAMYVGTAGPVWIFSLSGNPHAALAGFYSLVRPALAALAGIALRDRGWGRLAEPCAVRRDGHRLLWAEPGAAPGTFQPLNGFSVLESLTRATALLLVPPGEAPLADGAAVEVVALDPAGWGAL